MQKPCAFSSASPSKLVATSGTIFVRTGFWSVSTYPHNNSANTSAITLSAVFFVKKLFSPARSFALSILGMFMRPLRWLAFDPAERGRAARLHKQAFQHVGERLCVDVAHELAVPRDGNRPRLPETTMVTLSETAETPSAGAVPPCDSRETDKSSDSGRKQPAAISVDPRMMTAPSCSGVFGSKMFSISAPERMPSMRVPVPMMSPRPVFCSKTISAPTRRRESERNRRLHVANQRGALEI
jgi:hypothetical protein